MFDTSKISGFRKNGMLNTEILSMMGEGDPALSAKIKNNILDNPALEDWEKEKSAEYYLNKKMGLTSDVKTEDRVATSYLKSNPFNSFSEEKQGQTFSQRLNNALPKEGSILGNRGQKLGNVIQNIQQQQGGDLGYMNVPEIALSVAGQGIGAVNDMIGSALAPALSPVVKSVQESPGLLGPIAQGIGEGLEPIADWFRSYKEKNPRKGAAIEATGQIASMLPIEKAFKFGAPVVKGLAKEGTSLATKGAKAVAENIPTIPMPKSDRVADRLLQTALELNANQIRNISKPNIAGKNPFSWMRERGIIGTRNEVLPMLEDLATSSRDAKISALSGIGGKFAVKQSDQALDEILKQVAPDGVPRAGLEELANKAALLRTLPEKSLAQLEDVKSLMDDVLGMYGKTGDGVDNIKAQGWRNLRDNLKVFIERQADSAGVPDIKRLNKDIQVSRSIINALEYTGGDLPYTKLIPAIRKLGGAGGAGALGFMVAGPLGAFAGVGIERMLASPKIQTMMARMLARYSDDEIKAVKALLEKGKTSNVAKRVMDEISEDLSEVLKTTSETRQLPQGSPTGSSKLSSPTTLPEQSSVVNPPQSKVTPELQKKFPNLTPEEIASLTPEEKSLGMVGGSDSVGGGVDVSGLAPSLDSPTFEKGFAVGDTVTMPTGTFKVGDTIDLGMAGAPPKFPKPWKLKSAINEPSSVDGANHVTMKIEAANGKVMDFKKAEIYSPSTPSPLEPLMKEANGWDVISPQKREEILKMGGWTTKNNSGLNPTGKSLLKKNWSEISDAGKSALSKYIDLWNKANQ